MSRKKCPNPREMVLGAGGLILAGALHALKFTRGCPAPLMYIYGRVGEMAEGNEKRYVCDGCPLRGECPYAYDPYCTDECLYLK